MAALLCPRCRYDLRSQYGEAVASDDGLDICCPECGAQWTPQEVLGRGWSRRHGDVRILLVAALLGLPSLMVALLQGAREITDISAAVLLICTVGGMAYAAQEAMRLTLENSMAERIGYALIACFASAVVTLVSGTGCGACIASILWP